MQADTVRGSEGAEAFDDTQLVAIADSARSVCEKLRDAPADDDAAWRELAGAGWFSLLVPEEAGGLGLSLRHMVALHEELGRRPIRPPVIGCGLLPAVLLGSLPLGEVRDALLEPFTLGERVAGVAWQDATGQLVPGSGCAATLTGDASGRRLDGRKRWAVSTGRVDGWLVDAVDESRVRHLLWVPHDAEGVAWTPAESVDEGWFGELGFRTVASFQVVASGDAVTRALVHAVDVARIAQAAELLGLSRQAFELTLDYLKNRVQFGKPIGTNQALQHRMVDLHIRLEMAEAGLDAAVDKHLRDEIGLAQAASWAKARAADVALRVTRAAVQLHGAIGLTDEYLLGRYWKRALFLATWLGSPERLAGRHLDQHGAGETTESGHAAPDASAGGDWARATLPAFRRIVRAFLEANHPPALRNPHRRLRLHEVKDWYDILSRQGWLAPAWPREHGGMGLTPEKWIAFVEEFEDFGAARLPDQGIINVGPTLIRFGTSEQRRRYLPKILSGDEIWCQGFSEPNAGSDLASLRTRADRDGDHFVVNGQKIWSTLAHDATHMFMLVRTSVEAKKHDGISFLLVDLATPGVTVRPIRNIAGEDEFCEVFFDDVRVPVENLVGEVGQGWKIGMGQLGFERLFVGSPKSCQLALAQLERLATARGLWIDAQFRAIYGELLLDLLELKAAFARFADLVGRGQPLPDNVSILKVWATETYTRISAQLVRFADEEGALVGKVTLPDGGSVAPMASLLNAAMTTIYAGSNEIQKNILAKRALELPA